jgi:hypothetical protein
MFEQCAAQNVNEVNAIDDLAVGMLANNLTDKEIKQAYWDKIHVLYTIEGLAMGMLSRPVGKQIHRYNPAAYSSQCRYVRAPLKILTMLSGAQTLTGVGGDLILDKHYYGIRTAQIQTRYWWIFWSTVCIIGSRTLPAHQCQDIPGTKH